MSQETALPLVRESLYASATQTSGSYVDHSPVRQIPMHPLLNDELSKDIIFRYHQQRSFLRRAVEKCAEDRVYLPPLLMEALRCVLCDEVPPTASTYVTHEQHSISELANLLELSSTSRKKQVIQQSESSREDASLNIEDHVDIAQHSILHHPQHAATVLREQELQAIDAAALAEGVVLPPRVTTADLSAPKELLQAAFDAKRRGDRRREIEILIDYIRRGREGRIQLNTATTMRLLRQVGDAHASLSEHVAAEQYYFDWYLIADKVGDKSEAARALTLLGEMSHAKGDFVAAQDWLRKAQWFVNR